MSKDTRLDNYEMFKNSKQTSSFQPKKCDKKYTKNIQKRYLWTNYIIEYDYLLIKWEVQLFC